MKITDGGFVTMIGGLIIMLGCCGTPRRVNHNDKTVMINPPRGVPQRGGVNENLTPVSPGTSLWNGKMSTGRE